MRILIDTGVFLLYASLATLYWWVVLSFNIFEVRFYLSLQIIG